jgi:DNA-binding response OmpR family regulator
LKIIDEHPFDLLLLDINLPGPNRLQVLEALRRSAKVLEAVWGGPYGDQSDYVWTFVQRIRRKIEPDRTQPRYVLTGMGVGYRMPVPETYGGSR